MKRTAQAPAPAISGTPEQALERMKAFTRRIITVSKAAIVKPKKALRKHR